MWPNHSIYLLEGNCNMLLLTTSQQSLKSSWLYLWHVACQPVEICALNNEDRAQANKFKGQLGERNVEVSDDEEIHCPHGFPDFVLV